MRWRFSCAGCSMCESKIRNGNNDFVRAHIGQQVNAYSDLVLLQFLTRLHLKWFSDN